MTVPNLQKYKVQTYTNTEDNKIKIIDQEEETIRFLSNV